MKVICLHGSTVCQAQGLSGMAIFTLQGAYTSRCKSYLGSCLKTELTESQMQGEMVGVTG